MRNSPALPLAALCAAVCLAGLAGVASVLRGPAPAPLSEVQIGLITWAFVLVVFGLHGVLSVALEGPELHPGRVAPRLTGPLSVAIVVLAVTLVGLAVVLGGAILTGQSVAFVGSAAGAGCLALALLLVAYKEALLGDEVRLDARKDGIPW